MSAKLAANEVNPDGFRRVVRALRTGPSIRVVAHGIAHVSIDGKKPGLVALIRTRKRACGRCGGWCTRAWRPVRVRGNPLSSCTTICERCMPIDVRRGTS